MNPGGFAQSVKDRAARLLLAADNSQSARRWTIAALFVFSFAVWSVAQIWLTATPVWERVLPPEVDDSLTYVVKTRQMEDCFFQDCPALEDLRTQFYGEGSDGDVSHQQGLAGSRVFPVYHPLFSVVLIGIKKLCGTDLMTAYKIVWTAGPILFGAAFAYLVGVLWGVPAAGWMLLVTAFKVFPDTGLHHVVPSNVCMAMACVLWARVLSTGGAAPWAMTLGTLALVAMHPVGRIYAVMAVFLSLAVSNFERKPRVLAPAAISLGIVAFAFVISGAVERPMLFTPTIAPADKSFLEWILVGASRNALAVLIETIRVQAGLFGSLTIFCGAVMLGLLSAEQERRGKALKFVAVNLFFLAALMFYVSDHPADVIFRMCIPLVIGLLGAVGAAAWFVMTRSWRLLIERVRGVTPADSVDVRRAWPLAVLAILVGYSMQTVTVGAEQVITTREHLMNRQPLALYPSQPKLLLSKAEPGDRVVYTSMIVMPYYFIYGAMDLGAIYYHPALEESSLVKKRLESPDVRFAVTYNPLVWHPTFEGRDETLWWTTSPEFRFSMLNKRRIHGPLSREGVIPAKNVDWIYIRPQGGDFPRTLRLLVSNPGPKTTIVTKVMDERGADLPGRTKRIEISGEWKGEVTVELGDRPDAYGVGLFLPPGDTKLTIRGMAFGDARTRWPWAEKADVAFQEKSGDCDPIVVSFDPAKLLPPAVTTEKLNILDDRGSSVLFELAPPTEKSGNPRDAE